MKSRKKTVVSTILLSVLVILGSYVYAHIDKNIYLYDRNADTSTYYGTGILIKDEKVSQTFVSTEDNIDGINIKISLTGNIADVVLHYALIDLTTNEAYEAQINTNELENNKFNKLPVERITGAKGKPYKLVLSSENSVEQNGISFYAAHGVAENQKLTIKEVESEGTLVARMICHRFDLETFIVFIGIVTFIVVFMKVLYKSFK